MKEGIIRIEIVGKTRNYSDLIAENGYCFYDADLPQEERNYMTSISTPILNETELKRKFVAVLGNVDELNDQLAKEREEKENANGSL